MIGKQQIFNVDDNMPQVVPQSDNHFMSPPQNGYSNYDMSFLSNDDDGTSLNSYNQNTSFYQNGPPPPYSAHLSQDIQSMDYIPTTVYSMNQKQIDQSPANLVPKCEIEYWLNSQENLYMEQKPSTIEQNQQTSVLLQQLQAGPQYQYYQTPQNHISGAVNCQQQDSLKTIFPPSPVPSVESLLSSPRSSSSASSSSGVNYPIKQEFSGGLFPPSPPDSFGAPSPMGMDIKTEPYDSDGFNSPCFDHHMSGTSSQDHQVLRECLEDTTFQRRHNLKPISIESLTAADPSDDEIAPVIQMALECARKEMQDTCATLNIPSDPELWSAAQSQSWIEMKVKQIDESFAEDIVQLFPESGVELLSLSEQDFIMRLPMCGSAVYANFEIWKAAASSTGINCSTENQSSEIQNDSIWSPTMSNSEIEDDELSSADFTPTTNKKPVASTSSNIVSTKLTGVTKPGRQGGSHIHLWQFLKELLNQPQSHGTSIRWLDRSRGVFKIEDSVSIARSWGSRKNRPAMNYDKLSRSIRQYYKKGIMKKTERSQRLVYQFCHPYNL